MIRPKLCVGDLLAQTIRAQGTGDELRVGIEIPTRNSWSRKVLELCGLKLSYCGKKINLPQYYLRPPDEFSSFRRIQALAFELRCV